MVSVMICAKRSGSAQGGAPGHTVPYCETAAYQMQFCANEAKLSDNGNVGNERTGKKTIWGLTWRFP